VWQPGRACCGAFEGADISAEHVDVSPFHSSIRILQNAADVQHAACIVLRIGSMPMTTA